MKDAKPARVLIADDNTDFSKILEIFLSQTKDIDIVGTASDGIEALRAIKETKPDVVLLDIIMPQLDGLDILRQIKESRAHRPQFIMISALVNEPKVLEARELGASAYMTKPLDLHELRQCILRIYKTCAANQITVT